MGDKKIKAKKVDKDKSSDIELDSSLRPGNFDEVIGRTKEKKNLQIMISAAGKRKEPVDHILFHGPPGLGKTTLAHVVANEMKSEIFITSGPAIERQGDLAAILTNIPQFGILFIDEIHRLSRAVEEILYPAMEDRAIDIVLGKGPSARTLRLELEDFSIIGATTRIGLLSAPLRSRFGAHFRLDYYSDEDLMRLVMKKSPLLKIGIDDKAAREIARRSRGTARIAERYLKRVRDYAQVANKNAISLEIVKKVLDMHEVDKAGLDNIDRKILKVIINDFGGGPVGLSTIAAAISEELNTVAEVYEPFLIQSGFLKRTPRGRIATFKAKKHLNIDPVPKENSSNKKNSKQEKLV